MKTGDFNMPSKLITGIAILCASNLCSAQAPTAASEQKARGGGICLFTGTPPAEYSYVTLRKLKYGKGSYGSVNDLLPRVIQDAKAAGADALTSLTNLANHMVAGLAPRELAPFIAGAPLMALVKAGGGLRPIAIGETIRRLVSNCCCEATTEEAKVIFGPLQVGVATQGGAEASVHAVRKLAQEFGDDSGKRSCSRLISQTLSTWWIVP